MKAIIKKLTTFEKVPAGSLFLDGHTLVLKSEYGDNTGKQDAYIVGSGEYYAGGTSDPKERNKLEVITIELIF